MKNENFTTISKFSVSLFVARHIFRSLLCIDQEAKNLSLD